MRPASSPPDEPHISSAPAVSCAVRLSVLVSGLVTALGAVAAGSTLELSSPLAASAAPQPADSMKAVDALLAKSPNDASLRFRKGLLLAEQKRSAEAIAVFRKLADDFPLMPEPQNNLAVLYAERGEPDKARVALEAALRSRPIYDTIYRNLGTVNARIAGAAYARALNIDDSKSGLVRLALVPFAPGSEVVPAVSVAQVPAPLAPAIAVAVPPVVAVAAPAAAMSASSAKVMVAAAPVAAPATAPATTPATAPPGAPLPTPAKPPATTAVAASVPTATVAPKPVAPMPSAAASVVAAAAKPVGPAPAPAATPPKPAPIASAASADEAAVRKAVQVWARAWSNKQTDAYIATYVPGFSGGESSASAWQAARRLRITGKKDIDVGVSDLKVTGGKTRWSASFTQSYSADSLSLVSRKTLDFEARGGRWLIVRENNGKSR